MKIDILEKKDKIIEIINTKINSMDTFYRTGKSLERYLLVLNNRKNESNVKKYLSNDTYLTDIYKTLSAWDMNKRGAKLNKLSEIKQSISDNMELFLEIERMNANIIDINFMNLLPIVKKLYAKLCIMESGGKLVSFSKTLHFIFPHLFMPMDRQNTLMYIYNNTSESYNKFVEIFSLSYYIAQENINWKNIIGKNKWNTTIPKIIDNAILLRDY